MDGAPRKLFKMYKIEGNYPFLLLPFILPPPSSQKADSGQNWTEVATVQPRGTLQHPRPDSTELHSHH